MKRKNKPLFAIVFLFGLILGLLYIVKYVIKNQIILNPVLTIFIVIIILVPLFIIFLGKVFLFFVIPPLKRRLTILKDRMDAPFAGEARKLWEDAMRAQAYGRDTNNESKHSSYNYRKRDDSVYRPKVNHGQEELKTLYKELLRKYHPDFAQGEEDKKFRTNLTIKINKAYKEGDIATLHLFK